MCSLLPQSTLTTLIPSLRLAMGERWIFNETYSFKLLKKKAYAVIYGGHGYGRWRVPLCPFTPSVIRLFLFLLEALRQHN